MKKIFIILLVLSIISITACSPDKAQSDTPAPNESTSNPSKDTTSETGDDVDDSSGSEFINMQNYTLTVPDSYELLQGGHDGVKYNNAILKPKDSIAYEIELDSGIFFINSVEERKGVIAHEFGATTLDISTEEFIQEGVAYTYTFEHDTRGHVQAIELVTGTKPIYYMRGFIDVKDSQGLSDPTKALSSFIAKNITLVEIKAD